MTEITNENFEQMLPIIENSIKSSSFIAVDTEMTGLVWDQTVNPSLFDSVEQRYEKQRISVSNFIVCQIGLSFYSRDNFSNLYHAKTYSIHLCPISLSNQYRSFAFDFSANEFLVYNNFDFNKFHKKGINYMNEIEEQDLRTNFRNYSIIDFVNSPLDLEKSISQISQWITARHANANCDNQLILDSKPTINPLVNYIYINELMKNFQNIWIKEINNSFIVRIVDLKERIQLLSNADLEEEKVINRTIGFSLIFKCMVESKRPIVGHNMIMDLLYMYHHFYRPLPKKLKDFKSSLHSLFPYIFDTKNVIFNEQKNLSEISHVIKLRSLSDIYYNLVSDEIANSIPESPAIHQCSDEYHIATDDSPHDAGFDAFATGFVFIKIAHILMLKNKSDQSQFSYTWFELLKAVEHCCNKVNLIRANAHYMCLTGPDPMPVRPSWIFACKRFSNSDFSLSKLASILSTYGNADLKSIGSDKAIITVSSFEASRNILKLFRDDNDIKVENYNLFKHNKHMRFFLWSSFCISSCFVSILAINLIKSLKH